ncbi:sensor histidine kinase [Thalassotalea marina]|uniref:Histidine kinase n=1 Tax=Thalassotalea marina TaxID=1673741 RepID=A0A919BMI8_9GAMM|nr:histidine kinase [Thalassotalea marina]GHF99925.1 histidine kinase [Thalassotalea marina]
MSKSDNKMFWLCQVLGWGAFTLLNLTVRGYFSHFAIGELINSLTLYIAFIATTTCTRWYFKRYLQSDNVAWNFVQVVLISVLTAFVTNLIVSSALFPFFEPLYGVPLTEPMRYFWLALPNLVFLSLLWSITYLTIRRQFLLKSTSAQNSALQSSLKAAQLDILLNQLNPHFMFNAINNIRALILEDPAKARDCLTDLSDVMRTTMQVKQDKEWTLHEELQLVDSYLNLNKLQFENKLSITKSIDEQALSSKVPCMMVQLLVENAIKHGIGKRRAGGDIHIDIRLESEVLTLCVNNSGELNTDADTTGVGTRNIKSRLNILYGEQAHYSLKQVDDMVQASIVIGK